MCLFLFGPVDHDLVLFDNALKPARLGRGYRITKRYLRAWVNVACVLGWVVLIVVHEEGFIVSLAP